MVLAYMESPLGTLELKGDTEGLQSVRFANDISEPTGEIPESLRDVAKQLQEYFEGGRTDFDIKCNPDGTPFQKKVWRALMEVPYGKTKSYLQLSRELGDEKAIRAVASANGKNPIAIIIPCHRVVGSDGSLTGYAGGLNRKKWLLDHESPFEQMKLFEG